MNASSKKIFHVEIVVDYEKVTSETKAYQKMSEILSLLICMERIATNNFYIANTSTLIFR
ncbi:hypothetical protein PMI13_04049 [Chryseobacterium populi]|uniref:Uncharacterized protein n=1 Tax=Chryseobacterium populi TaxID=1144316 RepID=J3CAX1_9FLAO|nr:hypothetical protein PMI13_04049 [Chryseobacterium populi]